MNPVRIKKTNYGNIQILMKSLELQNKRDGCSDRKGVLCYARKSHLANPHSVNNNQIEIENDGQNYR